MYNTYIGGIYMTLTYVVDKESKFKTVREVILNEFHISSRLLTVLRKNKRILLNNTSTYLDNEITLNDCISINLDFDEDNSNIIPCNKPLDIIYEDESYIVISKPAGIPTHPSCLHFDNTLSNMVKAYFDSINLKRKIRPVNRLDKDTSGLVVFAKNQYIHERLSDQMLNNQFHKEYLAILEGNLETKSGIIDAPISRKSNSIIEREISSSGEKAITHFECIENYDNYCVVKFVLKTGRTHQIRVHSKYINHPILGDTLYGKKSTLINRQALHAYKISFFHPIKKSKVTYTRRITL